MATESEHVDAGRQAQIERPTGYRPGRRKHAERPHDQTEIAAVRSRDREDDACFGCGAGELVVGVHDERMIEKRGGVTEPSAVVFVEAIATRHAELAEDPRHARKELVGHGVRVVGGRQRVSVFGAQRRRRIAH